MYKILKEDLMFDINDRTFTEPMMGERVGPFPMAPTWDHLDRFVTMLKYVTFYYNRAHMIGGELYIHVRFINTRWEMLYEKYKHIILFKMKGSAIAAPPKNVFRLEYSSSIVMEIGGQTWG